MSDEPILHSYPWYAHDWLTSQSRFGMTAVQRSIYRDLLDHCWMVGSLPNDERALQCMAAVSRREWEASWPSLSGKFELLEGRLHHPKVDGKREELIRWHEQKRSAGKAGGKASVQAKRKQKSSGRLISAASETQANLKPSTSIVEEAKASSGSGEANACGETLDPGAQIAQWLVEFTEGRMGDPPPSVILQVANYIGPVPLEDWARFLVELMDSGRRPSKSWGWFVAVTRDDFHDWRRANGLTA